MSNAAPQTSLTSPAEKPEDGAIHCINAAPYNRIIFHDLHGPSKTPRYWVGGVDGGPWSAENALKKAGAKHGGTCFYCKAKLDKDAQTIDHIEGRTSPSIQNLVLACKPCNTKKGHQPIEAFDPNAGRAWLEALLQQVEARLKKLG